MRLVEEVADLLVLEHALVHTLRDRQTVLLKRGNGGLHEMNGVVAQCIRRHGITLETVSRGPGKILADARELVQWRPTIRDTTR